MATFSDDFSTRSGTADATTPNAITGWTGNFPSGSAAFASASIVTDAGAIGGKVLRLVDTGWSSAADKSLYVTDIGAVADDTTTEMLCGWRLESGVTAISAFFHYAPGFIRELTTNIGRRYQVGHTIASGTHTQRLWYVQNNNDWSAIGAAKDVSSNFVAGDWWWTRIQVDGGATGNWRWRTWKDGDAEPGTWQNADSANTTVRGGYVGVGIYLSTGWHMDVQWFSVGTGGDAAPEPSAGGGGRKSLLASKLLSPQLLRSSLVR